MIIVRVEVHVDPDSVAAMKDALAEMENETRKEAGCIDYAFSQEINNPGVLRVSELWADMAALGAHMKSPHMAKFQGAIVQHAPTSVDVKFYKGEEVSGPA